MFSHALTNHIPIVMLLSGGYQKNNAKIIADSIANLNQKFNLITKSLQGGSAMYGVDGAGPAPAL